MTFEQRPAWSEGAAHVLGVEPVSQVCWRSTGGASAVRVGSCGSRGQRRSGGQAGALAGDEDIDTTLSEMGGLGALGAQE